jgi:hypothetical protein
LVRCECLGLNLRDCGEALSRRAMHPRSSVHPGVADRRWRRPAARAAAVAPTLQPATRLSPPGTPPPRFERGTAVSPEARPGDQAPADPAREALCASASHALTWRAASLAVGPERTIAVGRPGCTTWAPPVPRQVRLDVGVRPSMTLVASRTGVDRWRRWGAADVG